MIIIGLNHGEINSSAAIYSDGKIVAGAAEERFNRKKRTKDFPKNAMQYCLREASVGIEDVDYVAQAWNPGAAWAAFNPMLSRNRIKREDYFYTVTDHLYDFVDRDPKDWVLLSHPSDSNLPPIYFVQHHRSHAANAFFMSTFDQAAIVTADWRGEFECLTLGHGRGNSIEISTKQHIPNSIGMFYATFTELLGYRPDSDEWKVMAMSAFDVDCAELTKKIRSTIELVPGGKLRLDQSYYKGALIDQPHLYTDRMVELLGGRTGEKGAEPDEWYLAVARAMQMVAEEIANHYLDHIWEITKAENVALSGGFFMNSVYNGKVVDRSRFKNVYISHAPSDVGNSLGAALYVAHCIHHEARDYSFSSSYLGPSYSEHEIERSLERRNISFEVMSDPARHIARILADGDIVACFNGRMEFGERALGNRSILADPRPAGVKDKINAVIKYRESYRPFAPAVLADRAHQYFEVEPGYECHYMEKVVPVRKGYRDKLAAITHVDGSGRLQTVERHHNNDFYEIISEFDKLTGYPLVLNTSFNINGEPIVQSPDDALSTFFNSGLTHLAMGKYLVTKK